MSSQRRIILGGDIDRPDVNGTNPNGMNGKMKNLKSLKNLWRKNQLDQSQAHRPSRYGKRRWHHHHHKKYNHLGFHHRNRMMRLKNEQDRTKVLSRGPKNLNPHREVTSIVIHIYFLPLQNIIFHSSIFTFLY
jgi:hypothetical protein